MVHYKPLFTSWFAHLIERLVRLHQYVAERAAEAPGGHAATPTVIGALLDELDNLASWFLTKAEELRKDERVDENRAAYYAVARRAANEFRRLHEHLTYIPTPWPRPELALFVKRILDEADLQSHGGQGEDLASWAILLTGEYNFSHILIGREGRPLGHGALRLRNVLSVPAVEKDNPLVWANLIHELAHWIGQRRGIVEQVQALESVTSRPPHVRAVLEQWAHEIVADLIATDWLGLSYLGSFVTFAAYWIPHSLREHSELHPSPEARVTYILHRLKGHSPAFRNALVAQLSAEYDGRLTLDNEDDDTRDAYFEGLVKWEATTPGLPDSNALCELVNEIVRLPAYRLICSSAVSEADVIVIEDIEARIEAGEFVASRRVANAFKTFKSAEQVHIKLEDALDQLREIPNRVTHILAAATLRKLAYAEPIKDKPTPYHSRLLAKFCTSPEARVRDRLVSLQKDVGGLDNLVTKSIEATAILDFYQRSDG